MNYKNIIVTVIMIHLLCQCTLNNCHYERVATESNSSDIDQSLINIIKLYIKKNPNIESVALYFNNEIDANIANKYGLGTYFTIGELYSGGELNQVNIGGKTKCVKMNETLNQWKAL